MLSNTCLLFVAFFGGIIFACVFLSLDTLAIKATSYIKARQRKQSAARLLAIAFHDPMHG